MHWLSSGIRLLLAFGCLASQTSAATLLLRYGFNEGSSGNVTAVDSGTDTPAPGTFVGGATRTSNTPGGASIGALDLTTPGGGTYVDGGDADKLDNLTSFTLTAWINVQDIPLTNLRIMSKQAATTFEGFSWNFADPASGAGTRTASNFGLRLFVGGSTAFAFDPAPSSLSIDADHKWVFLAVSYDGTSVDSNVNYYVGSPADTPVLASTTTVNAGPVLPSAAKFGVGYTDAAPTADTAPPAYIDDVRVYSGVLTPQELETVRQANIPEPATAVLLCCGGAAVFGVARGRRSPLGQRPEPGPDIALPVS